MRVLVVGGGGIGYALAESLAAQHDIVVIESNPERTDQLGRLDVQSITGNGTNPAVLRRAGAAEADLLIATTGLSTK